MNETTHLQLPSFLDPVVDFPDGVCYELAKPLATYRSCQDGTPFEARMVFTCRRRGGGRTSSSGRGTDEEFVMKIKVQYATEKRSLRRGVAVP